MFILYNLLSILALIIAAPFLLYKILTSERYKVGFNDRLCGQPKNKIIKRPIWIHASSVGEVKIAGYLISAINKRWPAEEITLSTFTDSGFKLAKSMKLKNAPFFLPIDIYFPVERTVKNINPKLFVTIESELWPNLLHCLKKNSTNSILINGRISEKSFKNYKKAYFFIKNVLNNLSYFTLRTKEDLNRLLNLGVKVEKTYIAGNLKYENALTASKDVHPETVREDLNIDKDKRIIVFGCTRDGEEDELTDLFKELLSRYNDLEIIIAPRHIQRVSYIEELLNKNNLKFIKSTQIGNKKDEKITIIDTIGNLFKIYSIAKIAFVGGSLKPFGGQNILEPAVFGVPVIFGKYISNFKNESYDLINSGGGFKVSSVLELKKKIFMLMDNKMIHLEASKNAKQAINNSLGALEKNLNIIDKFIDNTSTKVVSKIT